MSNPLGVDPARRDNDGGWTVSIDGEETRHLRSRWTESVNDEDWDGVIMTAASVLGHCPNPTGPARQTVGLALGKIQSGKTLSYTALIALAVDNGYRITVVLAGTKKPLLEQNYTRLFNDIAEGRPIVTPFKNPIASDADVIRSVLHAGGHALIVVLKNRTRIDRVRNLLGAPELSGYPTIVIDDEGDEASLNTQFRQGAQSPVYGSILGLRGVLSKHAYIAYTGTPQANLLIAGIDGLSPDFGVLVNPGQGYCGGSVFFGQDRDRYIRIVPDAEALQDHQAAIPTALRMAMAAFLVGGTIRHRTDPNAWHSMLIHNSNLKADHQALQNNVRNLIGMWRDTLALDENDPARTDLLELFHKSYDDLCTTVREPPSWEYVNGQLRNEIWLVEVWMVNSLPQSRDPMGTPFRLRNNILVGGNMLGRGLTISGLAVTYITRRAQQETNADTMEQRSRWFGYKQDYLDICRIFLTFQLQSDYTELLRHEDDFWEALQRNQRQGLSIRDWPRMFRLDMGIGLTPTRAMVADYRQFRGEGWTIQRRLVEAPETASSNLRVVQEFFAQHPGATKLFGNTDHLVSRDCPTGSVITELLSRMQLNGTDWDTAYSNEYLARLLMAGTLPSMDVMWMSCGRPRERSSENGQIENPMQGRTPNKEPSDPTYYPGDENIHGNRVQLQVHTIRPKVSGTPLALETPILALYIPRDDPRFDLRFVIRG